MRFKLNRAGVKDLMQSSDMQAGLSQIAEGIQSRAGDGYGSEVLVAKNRAVAFVRTETPEAKTDNALNNTLLKSLKG